MPPTESPGQTIALRLAAGDAERSLVLAARRGDEDAFRDLYLAFREPVWNLITSLVGDPVQAQDVLQDVFFKAFQGLTGFRFRSCLFTWIYRIAHNECQNHIRRRGAPLLPLVTIQGSPAEIDGRLVPEGERARRAALRGAVMELPFKMREVVVLRYMEDLSYKEMSRILRCPPGTVASRLARALAELEARLGPEGAA
ncbi:MAG TPA: RNA polymerase sigma factor [Burkholderiales bacterium]|nr:RNA polymerase sigma factor [Burkholderiales bacterium]